MDSVKYFEMKHLLTILIILGFTTVANASFEKELFCISDDSDSKYLVILDPAYIPIEEGSYRALLGVSDHNSSIDGEKVNYLEYHGPKVGDFWALSIEEKLSYFTMKIDNKSKEYEVSILLKESGAESQIVDRGICK